MNAVQFKNFDLNLIRVLLALLEHRSVSRAAQELALTPSAVSHALGRLRTALSDPLFERRGGGLVPTAFALETGRRMRPSIDRLRDAMNRDIFDPATADREFVIAAGTYVTTVFIPPVIEEMTRLAPNIRLRLQRAEEQSLEDAEHGRLDLVFGIAPGPGAGSRLEWRPFARERMAWVARTGHPFVHAPLTLDMLAEARHIVIEKFNRAITTGYPEVRYFTDVTRELGDASRAAAGQGRRDRPGASTIVSDPVQAIAIAARTDQVTLSLRRLAEMFLPQVQILDAPHPSPEIEMGVLSHPDRARDPGVRWLIDLIVATCGKTP